MKQTLKNILPKWGFWTAVLLFFECVLRLACVYSFWGTGLIFIALFSVGGGALLTALAGWPKNKWAKWINGIILVIIFLIFAVQLVYHDIFKAYCTIFAALNGGEAFMFFGVMLNAIWNVKYYLLALIVPLAVYFIWGRRLFEKSGNFKGFLFSLAATAVSGAVCIGVLFAFGTRPLGPYDLYFGTASPDLSVEKLGMLPTVHSDLRRTVFGESKTFSFVPENGSGSNANKNHSDYNVLDIDFEKLAEQEELSYYKALHQYFATVQPTEKNQMTGIFKGKNLIFLTCESLAPYAISRELTPTLYSMMRDSISFTNFYSPLWGTGTSDAEFTTLTGLLPRGDVWAMDSAADKYLPFAMGNQFRNIGYNTLAYHNNTGTFYGRSRTHPNLGYSFKSSDDGLKIKNPDAVPASDVEMIEASVKDYLYSSSPFHVYYMTYSGHSPYSLSENAMSVKNITAVENLDCTDPAKAYLAANIELDKALKLLLDKLKEAGRLEDTVIALTSDHYPYTLNKEDILSISNRQIKNAYDYYESVFMIYNSGVKAQKVDKLSSNIDILPTLSNMFGLAFDSRLLMGRDIFSACEGLVILRDQSWLTDIAYNSPLDVLMKRGEEKVDSEYENSIDNIVANRYNSSVKIISFDYYKRILK